MRAFWKRTLAPEKAGPALARSGRFVCANPASCGSRGGVRFDGWDF
jgi:hypothetical protein